MLLLWGFVVIAGGGGVALFFDLIPFPVGVFVEVGE